MSVVFSASNKLTAPLLGMLLSAPFNNCLADLQIIHFNVGMGDATLIRDTSSNKTLLIDAGNRGFGKKVIVPELNKLNIKSINYFVATHYDADHIGGFKGIIDSDITISEKVFDRGGHTDREKLTPKENPTIYGKYLDAAGDKRKTLDIDCDGSSIDLGESTKVFVMSVSGKFIEDIATCSVGDKEINKRKDNDLSITLVIEHLNFKYVIAGDLTGGGKRTVDMESLVADAVGDVDVLHINHHGSSSSSNSAFLNTAKPEVAIISVGNGGSNRSIYNLPTQKTLDAISNISADIDIYLTNAGEGGTLDDLIVTDGHIVIQTNGHGYIVNKTLYPTD